MQAPEALAANVQQPTLRGRQPVAAIWFPADWFDPATQARRIVACWRPGAKAMRFSQGDLLCYATAIEMDCESLPGWPLRQEGRVLCSAVLTEQERAAAPEGDVLIVLGAEVLALYTGDAVPLDPASWLDIGPLTLHETYDCTTPPPAPIVLDLEARPVREVLGDAVPAASPEQARFLDALRSARRGSDRTTDLDFTRPGDISLMFIVRCTAAILALGYAARAASPEVREVLLTLAILAIVGFLLVAAKGFVPMLIRKLVESSASAEAATQDRLPERNNKRLQPQRWRQVVARWLMTSQIGRLVGRAQARYMRRMLGLFEDGNLAEALRHAIPLGGSTLGQAFGTPQARRDLTLSSSNGPAVGVNLGDDLEQHLRSLYRRAFDKLDRDSRIDEAVFVLAELLNARQEALDYLEKHQRFKQAAELALGWDMPSDVIVRLYCLADHWQRAIAVARRDSAFAGAVLQLEKKAPAAARRLRIEWGAALTQQGDWLGAVDAVWPDATLRPKAVEWLLTAEAAGGKLAARALLQRALLLPDTLNKYADYLEELRKDPQLWTDRAELAEALLAMRTVAPQEIAAIIAPMVIVDHAHGHRRFDRSSLQQLVKLSGDRLLAADLPARDWPVSERRPIAKLSGVLELDGPAAGAHAIYDAVPLHDQRYLVALGETGACVVDSSGRTRAHFAIPAQRLVLSQNRQVALALARRESLWRVSRIDLAQRNIVDLGLGDFQHFCDRFDGLHWSVARNQRLQVLDTHQSLREVVWQVTDLPGEVVAMTGSEDMERVLVMLDDEATEEWIYRLPERRLLTRDLQPPQDGKLRLLNSWQGSIDVRLDQPAPDHVLFLVTGSCLRGEFEYRLQTLPQPHLVLWTEADWLTISAPAASGYEVHWVLVTNGQARTRVRWPGERAPGIRAVGSDWLLFDTEGRLMCFNVDDGQHRNLTLR